MPYNPCGCWVLVSTTEVRTAEKLRGRIKTVVNLSARLESIFRLAFDLAS